jgi:hypothetical protein
MTSEAFGQALELLKGLSREDQLAIARTAGIPTYPWFEAISGDELKQGDILENCPVFIPPTDLATSDRANARFTWEERDLVVLSQSCDLVKERCKLDEVLSCAVWKRSELAKGHLSTNKGMEDARRGNLPAFHLLAESRVPGLLRPVRVVDFRRVYTHPVEFVRKYASSTAPRLRILPPYREHFAQAFARFFMRVGLPVDIPPFTK